MPNSNIDMNNDIKNIYIYIYQRFYAKSPRRSIKRVRLLRRWWWWWDFEIYFYCIATYFIVLLSSAVIKYLGKRLRGLFISIRRMYNKHRKQKRRDEKKKKIRRRKLQSRNNPKQWEWNVYVHSNATTHGERIS